MIISRCPKVLFCVLCLLEEVPLALDYNIWSVELECEQVVFASLIESFKVGM